MRVPLCLAVHGHIADSVRDHEPGRVVGSLRARKRRQRFTEPLAAVISMTTVLGDEYARPPRTITGGPTVWPTHGPRNPPAVTRTLLLISGCRLGLGRNCAVRRRGASFALPHPGGVRRQAAPAGPRVVCRMQRPATDEPRPPAGRCGAAAAPVSLTSR